MQTEILVETIDTHTAGEPTRIVVGGIDQTSLRGECVADKRDRFKTHHEDLRELLMCEPRGHDGMFGAVVVQPTIPAADVGMFFMDAGGYLDMCGHGTIGAITALIETGQLHAAGQIVVETPAGLVRTRPTVSGSRVKRVAVENVDSFVLEKKTVSVSEICDVPVDIVVAGNVFALVNAASIGVALDREATTELIDLGVAIREAINNAGVIVNPLTQDPREVSIVELYETDDGVDRNAVIFGDGQLDRSPCGTGTCAKMTLLYEHGALDVDEPYHYESLLGTRFVGRLRDVTERNGVVVTVPEVSGTAFITGKHTFFRNEDDTLGGFSLSA
ncbi:proline racemase family protein [Halalkalirubrum salinum]|uniref:proline racemase family protein n=1 Tax=Halalkalirubrum salinum TaxID=2563889 RepID=UPI0010FAD80E|nr:proline racemase family protein [Halalkalirubrum salinum]